MTNLSKQVNLENIIIMWRQGIKLKKYVDNNKLFKDLRTYRISLKKGASTRLYSGGGDFDESQNFMDRNQQESAFFEVSLIKIGSIIYIQPIPVHI
uniref:Uncharacterized protein n=1 Tax=Lepeophtheirus salmonis TaxID=72036 RepID=A0A0K2VG87_LEPSM